MLILPKQIKAQLFCGVLDTVIARLYNDSETLSDNFSYVRANTLKIKWNKSQPNPLNLKFLKLVVKDTSIELLMRRKTRIPEQQWRRVVIEDVRITNSYGPISASQFNALAAITNQLIREIEGGR